MPSRHIQITLPPWAEALLEPVQHLPTDIDRMRFAVRLARENVERGTGGPFGAIVVERTTGTLVAGGVNSVLRLQNPTLHAEMIAIQMATQRVGSYTLGGTFGTHELVTSCEPCAMCLGAVLWSGVTRLVCGATREDATALDFEEGPVFDESWRYIEERGIEVVRQVLRPDARAVLQLYQRSGRIYNG